VWYLTCAEALARWHGGAGCVVSRSGLRARAQNAAVKGSKKKPPRGKCIHVNQRDCVPLLAALRAPALCAVRCSYNISHVNKNKYKTSFLKLTRY
jgi:hypothetical protein